MKMYRTKNWNFEITEIEVTRQTEQSIWTIQRGKECRELKNTSYSKTFETKALAKQSIIDRQRERLDRAERDVKEATEDLQQAIAIEI